MYSKCGICWRYYFSPVQGTVELCFATDFNGRRLWNRAGHYIFVLWFLLSPSFFSSSILIRYRLDVYHTTTHDVALMRIRMQVWNVLHWKYRTQKIAKNSPSAHHRTNVSGCIIATKACIDNRKNILNSNIFSTCPHNMANFGLLTAEIGSGVWGTLANFNRFCVLASLLHRRRSTEVNQTLHDVWSSRGLLQYVYVLGALVH